MSRVPRVPPVKSKVSAKPTPSEPLLPLVLSYWTLCGFAALLLIAAQNALTAEFTSRPAQEWVYASGLAACAAVLLCLPWTLLFGIDRMLGRYGSVTGFIVLGAVFPFAHDLARQLASGEGVEALEIPALNLEIALTLTLCTGALCVWEFQRSRRSPGLLVPLGLIAVAGLLWFDHIYLRTYGMLAPLVLTYLLYVGTATLHQALRAVPRARMQLSAVAALALLTLLATGFVKPGWVDAGRSSVLADESSILSLDALLFGAEIDAVQFDLELAAKTPCAPIREPAAWPALTMKAAQRRNVILISVDALRRDVVGKLRAGKSLTPNLDRFARESRVATRAYTSYPATLFALAGASTGLLPSEVLFAPTPPDSMFRLIKKVIPDVFAVLPTSEWFVQPAFPKYVTQEAQRSSRHDAVAQTDDMLRRLKRLRTAHKQHVAWVHYLEPHGPYRSHPEFEFGVGQVPQYQSEVAFLDREIGRLLAALREGGWFEDSLIVFFADHGEALGERKYFGHHVFLNSWISNIPFMLHAPGLPAKPIEGAVSITDVAPTVLHFLDVLPKTQLSGQSLLGTAPARDRVIVSEAFPVRGKNLFDLANQPLKSVADLKARIALIQNTDRRYQPKVSIVRNDQRLIVRRTSGTAELYDTARDPEERHDLASERPQLVDDMMAQMAAWHRAEASRFYCAVRALPPIKPPPLPTVPVPVPATPRNLVPKPGSGTPKTVPSRAAPKSSRAGDRQLLLPPGTWQKVLKSKAN